MSAIKCAAASVDCGPTNHSFAVINNKPPVDKLCFANFQLAQTEHDVYRGEQVTVIRENIQ